MKGWFKMPGRDGDRTFEQQMMGLDWLMANCRGKTVLDAGCAEGLISKAMLDAGAKSVNGVELREDAVRVSRKLCREHQWAIFAVGDLNVWTPSTQYDIVVGLAILHKLRDPGAVAQRLCHAAREHIIWRLPPARAPVIIDARSGNMPCDIGAVTTACGFELAESSNDGPFGEWVGRYERVK